MPLAGASRDLYMQMLACNSKTRKENKKNQVNPSSSRPQAIYSLEGQSEFSRPSTESKS